MEKVVSREHSMTMMNRANMSLSGFTEVSEFSQNKVVLKTTMGDLCIKGKRLSVNQLNTESGTLDVKGEIQSIQYTTAAKDGFLTGLFK